VSCCSAGYLELAAVVLHVMEEGEHLLLMCVSCCCARYLELAAVVLHAVEEGEHLLLMCVSCCCARYLELAAVVLHVMEEGEHLLLMCVSELLQPSSNPCSGLLLQNLGWLCTHKASHLKGLSLR
jgi:hypothetical protein